MANRENILKILLKFKTLIFLAVLFVALGGWFLPKYYYTHTYNKLGDKADEFPVLMWRRHPSSRENPHPNKDAQPDLITLDRMEEERKYRSGMANYVPWKKPVDNLMIDGNRITLRQIALDDGRPAFKLDISNELHTVTAVYRVANDKVYPEFTRLSGLSVWGMAFVPTFIVAVLVRSMRTPPQNQKKLRAYQHRKKR